MNFTKEEKTRFAEAFLRLGEAFKAANDVWYDDTPRALYAATNLPKDKETQDEIRRIKSEDGELSFLPTKADLARAVWARMDVDKEAGGWPVAPDDFAKLAKLYAEIIGAIEKPQSGANITILSPKAIEVTSHGTEAEWEAELAKQQRELLNVSRTRH